jgi:ZIP family zinc transporter
VPASVASVFLFALVTAVATGLGAVPFVLARHPTRKWLGVSNAIAAGLMLAASFGLIYEGVDYGLSRTLAGALLGLIFIVIARQVLQHEEHPVVFASMGSLDAKKALLIVGVMTVHSFTEGVGLGFRSAAGRPWACSSRSPSPSTTSPRGSPSVWYWCPAAWGGAGPPPGASSRACLSR